MSLENLGSLGLEAQRKMGNTSFLFWHRYKCQLEKGSVRKMPSILVYATMLLKVPFSCQGCPTFAVRKE
jgi:hypothetical protein